VPNLTVATFLALATTVLSSSTPCVAQETDLRQQVRVCGAQVGGANVISADAKIAACTVLLESGRLPPRGKADVYVWRSLGYSAKGDSVNEMKDLDEAVKADPTDPNAWAQSCSAHTWTGNQTDRALKECSTAIDLAPGEGSPWTFRGDIYLTKHDYRRAIADYNRAILLSPGWMWPWDNRGEAYLRAGDIDRAMNDFNQVIKIAPDYAMGYLDRGIAQIRKGDLDAALADFEAALKVEPKSTDALYGRGVVKILKHDRVGGEADIRAAKARRPDAAKMFDDDGVPKP
jgi:tetratricopeptide (TPR) repeat protein